jgi:hypothetical protein
MSFQDFCDKVRFLGTKHGASVTSWGRSDKRNASVGGASRSRHRHWLACDLVFDTQEGKAACIEDAREFFDFVLDEGDHLHVHDNPRA